MKACSKKYGILKTNIYRWWKYYEAWGEIKPVLDEKMKKLKMKYKWTRGLNESHIAEIKRIVDEHPEFYLDEIAYEFCSATHIYFSISKISRILKNNLNYTLQVCYDVARQRDEEQRTVYKMALADLMNLHRDPKMLIYIDETHKDKNSSQRRRAWGKR